MTSNVDLFDDLQTGDSVDGTVSETSEGQPATLAAESADVENASSTDNSGESESESPVETVAQVPDGAMSITEFAAFMTKTLMKAKFMAGEDLDGTEYVVPQSVYQTVKAQRDRIPHVLVQGPDDNEARVYVLTDLATSWWESRRERLATRGSGSQRASSRTPEDNLTLLAEAVKKSLYANDRSKMWIERIDQAAKLVDKYKGFLSDAKVEENTVELAVQEATDQYNAEKAAKEAEKSSKKTGSKAETTEDNE